VLVGGNQSSIHLTIKARTLIVKCMLDQTVDLDRTFHALADRSRRSMVERLCLGPASVGELARPLDISLAAVLQHVQVLEACGIVTTEKVGRTRMCRIERVAVTSVEKWIVDRRQSWETRLSRLGDLLGEEAATSKENQ
jgi:DNA-binding transcriptional ArsR family regulator